MPKGLGLGVLGGQKFNFLNMVMWHIKLKGVNSSPGYTENFLPYNQTGDLGMGSKGQLPLEAHHRMFSSSMFVYAFVFDLFFLINLYASFFWFGTIFSEELFCLCCVAALKSLPALSFNALIIPIFRIVCKIPFWSPAGKELTSWLSCLLCFVTFPNMSWSTSELRARFVP